LINDIFWIFVMFSLLLPWFQRYVLETRRIAVLRQMEKRRKSRVIALVHRQESMSFLGVPFFRYIDIQDSEEILRAIRMTDDDVPIDIILHTPGGLVLAAEQIAYALRHHPAKVTAFIPHYAMSGGTMIALAADEIVMDHNAVLGPLDPQLGDKPAVSVLKVLDEKPRDQIDDETLILADISRKAVEQVRRCIMRILNDKYDEAARERIATELTRGRWTHDYPLTVEELRELGIEVSTDIPEEVYTFMSLHKQPAVRRPSVEYVPLPYGKETQS